MDKRQAAVLLGVPIDADDDAIQKAYRTKAKTCHPDAGGSHEAMLRLNEAVAVMRGDDDPLSMSPPDLATWLETDEGRAWLLAEVNLMLAALLASALQRAHVRARKRF